MHWFNCAEIRGPLGVSRDRSLSVTPAANSSPDKLPQGNTVLPCSSLHAVPAVARMQGGTARALERLALHLR